MLVLNPDRVTFGVKEWERVILLAVDRVATRQVVEWTEAGPHVVFADTAEQKVLIKVVSEVVRGEVGGPSPGEAATLTAVLAPTASDVGRRRITAEAVVTAVTHEVSVKKGAVRTVELVAVSPDGATDPIAIGPEGGGA